MEGTSVQLINVTSSRHEKMRRSDYQDQPSSTVSRSFLGNDRRVNPSVIVIDHSYCLMKLLHGYIGPSRGLFNQPVINDSANGDGEHTNLKRPKATAIFYFLRPQSERFSVTIQPQRPQRSQRKIWGYPPLRGEHLEPYIPVFVI